MSQGTITSEAETYASECTQCPASNSSNTTPGNIACIVGRLCLLIYLLGSRVGQVQNANREWDTHLLHFPFIATTWPPVQVRSLRSCGKSASSLSEFPRICRGTLNFAGSFGAVSKFVNKNPRTIGSCVMGFTPKILLWGSALPVRILSR